MTTARKDAQLAALGESVTYYQVEMHRHQQQLETQLQTDEDSRALPLYPRFLFKQQQPPQQQQTEHQKPSSSSSSPTSKHAAAAMVVRTTDEDTDLHHWKSPSVGTFADETKATDVPSRLPPSSSVAGSSATTRSLFDDLVATRRQLDDLSRLSNTQSPGTNYTHTRQFCFFFRFSYHLPYDTMCMLAQVIITRTYTSHRPSSRRKIMVAMLLLSLSVAPLSRHQPQISPP